MLIDDNVIDNIINEKMIEVTNTAEYVYKHTGAKNAIEFLRNVEKLKDIASSVLPDLIFLDIDMPLADGFEFLDEFEKLSEETKQKCKIIMLTSSIDVEHVDRLKIYPHAKELLNKPLSEDILKRI